MSAFCQTLLISGEIAIRNLFASRWKTLIVGGITAFGAMLALVGGSLVDAVDHSLGRSVASSIAGDIQVYSSRSRDKLELLGDMVGELPSLAPLEDFARLRHVLTALPNVDAVVPMAVHSAVTSSGNSVDHALAALRTAWDAWSRDPGDGAARARYESRKLHVRQLLTFLQADLESAKRVRARAQSEDASALRLVVSEQYWRDFDSDPASKLEYLDNHIAPLASDAELIFLLYLGTDPAAFQRTFDRMQIVEGEAIPPGKRGLLLSRLVYEEKFKLKSARGLDKLKAAIEERKVRISEDKELQRIVRQNVLNLREVLMQLDTLETDRFRMKLQGFLRSQERDLAKLLATFFDTSDEDFQRRYAFFYRELAPSLALYRVRIGDRLPLQVYTSSGYVQSAALKVYGTFSFRGLEKSPQAGLLSLMDLVSFRELYGFLTPERMRELQGLHAAANVEEVERVDAEAELFGNKADVGDASNSTWSSEARRSTAAASALQGTRARREQQAQSDYDPRQLEEGPVLSAAVMLKDERESAATMKAITRAGVDAGLPLKTANWQESSGIVGQFATLMRSILQLAVSIVFIVALVVISNALLMATLERVREIGTLRAIGAQRRLILTMLVVESVVVGLIAGTIGLLLGWALLAMLAKVGIPATTDALVFVFAGSRLIPSVNANQLLFTLITVLGVSLASGLYPAWLAMRVSPRSAMQTED